MTHFDELTGLPGRSALNEHLESLDGNFTLAMVDIDHFKAFSDTRGKEVGDQVLKLVAARLQQVGGGGTAYRTGEDEFAILFAGRREAKVMQYLESLRRNIDTYKVVLRDSARPRHPTPGTAKPATTVAPRWISITISMGVAERADREEAPEQVIEAADRALYRAKAEGRNWVRH